MLSYNDLYEILRKEKYSDGLQPLPKKFIEEFKSYLKEQKELSEKETELFSSEIAKTKKQLENAVSIFKEIMLKRKRKILDLVFVATETGIMKRDYENMLQHEKKAFDGLVKNFEQGDKELSNLLNNKTEAKKNKMIIFSQEVDQFMDHEGSLLGPFKKGELASLESNIAKILVDEEKANFVDQE